MGIHGPSLHLWIALIAGLCCQSSGQNVPKVETLISTPEKGENFTIQCTVTMDEPDNYIIGTLYIKMKDSGNPNSNINLVTLLTSGAVIINGQVKDRMTFDKSTSTLTVTNAKCGDERGVSAIVYECQQQWNNANTGAGGSSEGANSLRLRVPPGPVTMTDNVPQFKVEGENLSVTCTANVGRGDRGSIVWTVVSTGAVREIVDPEEGLVSDERIKLKETAGDPSCTIIEESIFTLTNLERFRQGLVVRCYVVNDDYRPVVLSSCSDEFCKETVAVEIYYPASAPVITQDPSSVMEGGSVTFSCTSDAVPPAAYVWSMGNTTFLTGVVEEAGVSRLTLDDLHLANDTGEYMCVASNEIRGVENTANGTISLTIEPSTPAPTTTTTTTTTPMPEGGNPGSVTQPDESDDSTVIIIICVFAGLLVVALIAGVIMYRRRGPKKNLGQLSEKPNTNRPMSYQNPNPDILADEKKFTDPSLNGSFDKRGDDGLVYADLTYDNRPRSRKPMALGDTPSEYSDVTMPQV